MVGDHTVLAIGDYICLYVLLIKLWKDASHMWIIMPVDAAL